MHRVGTFVMNTSQSLITVVLLQQSLFGALWLVAARLGLARAPARHWAASTLFVAAGMALILLRGRWDPWLTVWLANLLVLGGIAAVRRGVQRFARRRPADREQAVVLVLALGGVAAAVASGRGMQPVVVLTSAAIAWTLLRVAAEVRRTLAAEFGGTAALWCALPLALIGAVFALRGTLALAAPALFAVPIEARGGGNVAVMLASIVLGFAINAALIALVVVRLVRRLQFQSDHDVLTGLLSRRAMERALQQENQRRRRFGGGYALLSVDIDHFKRINDRHGHAAGDAVLTRVANALRNASREVDQVARMGGEEFCVLLPGADAAGAETVAARMLAAVRALAHPETGGTEPVTVSIGLLVVAQAPPALDALQRRLDQALYAAKSAGRDRIERAEPVPVP